MKTKFKIVKKVGALFLMSFFSFGVDAKLNDSVSIDSSSASNSLDLEVAAPAKVDLDRLCMHVIEGRRPFVAPGQKVTGSLRALLKAYDAATTISDSASCKNASLGILPDLMKRKGIADNEAELLRISKLADRNEMRSYLLKEYPALGHAEAQRIASFIDIFTEDATMASATVVPHNQNNQKASSVSN